MDYYISPLRAGCVKLRPRHRPLKRVTRPVLSNARLSLGPIAENVPLGSLLPPAPVYPLCPSCAPTPAPIFTSFPLPLLSVQLSGNPASPVPASRERDSWAFSEPLLVATDVQFHHQMTFLSMVLSSCITRQAASTRDHILSEWWPGLPGTCDLTCHRTWFHRPRDGQTHSECTLCLAGYENSPTVLFLTFLQSIYVYF